jgi:hypothetical protein
MMRGGGNGFGVAERGLREGLEGRHNIGESSKELSPMLCYGHGANAAGRNPRKARFPAKPETRPNGD